MDLRDFLLNYGLTIFIWLTLAYGIAVVVFGWGSSVDYVRYNLQFKGVIDELISCSQKGGTLAAQLVSTGTVVRCDLPIAFNVTGFPVVGG